MLTPRDDQDDGRVPSGAPSIGGQRQLRATGALPSNRRVAARRRAVEAVPTVPAALLLLGRALRAEGDDAGAAGCFQEALDLAWEQGDQGVLADCVSRLADVAIASGSHDRAARLLGAVDALREEAGAPDSGRAGAVDEAAFAARAVLGHEAYAAARAAGRAMPLPEVVAEAAAVAAGSAAGAGRVQSVAGGMGARLTRRERDVLRLIVAGKTDCEIADALSISRRTVTTHVTRILAKLGVASRAAAGARGIRAGLL